MSKRILKGKKVNWAGGDIVLSFVDIKKKYYETVKILE